MLRHATYPYSPQMAPNTHRYSGTSSAFSASANPNEDWTKISDLAERRRIQNRIAQRNYRKKLKKRLEDLERRAASNSASPEQRPAELERSKSEQGVHASPDPKKRSADQSRRASSISHAQQHAQQQAPYYANHDDRSMFSHQYTRQLSTSPPPFSYSGYSAETATYSAPYSTAGYSAISTAPSEVPMFTPYLPPPLSHSNTYPSALPTVMNPYPSKHEFYGEDEMSPFTMSYASMAGIDIPQAQPYQDSSSAQTPPLSESFEHSNAESPPEMSNFPATPASMPSTPPLHLM